jgi:mannan endo-1,4-beta-mannosidase
LVNIANEWSGTDYRNAYTAAINQLRSSGINHTLVIDANGFGQNAAAIMTDGPALLAADPQHNLVFSVHMYDAFSAARGGGQARITSTLEQAVTAGLPLVVGEFGWQGGTPPVAIDAAFIMSECARLRIGFFPWSWKGNDPNLAYLDLSVDWEGARLNPWGTQVSQGATGITQTARRATIFPP